MKIALIGRDANRVLAFRGSLIRAAHVRGHTVIAITGPTTPETQQILANAGVQWIGSPLNAGSVNPIQDFAFSKSLQRILREQRVDSVLAYNPKCLAYGPIAARKAGVQHVVGMVTGLGHGFIGGGWREDIVRLAKAWLYRRAFTACDAVLVQNSDDLSVLQTCGAVTPELWPRVHVISGSGVDVANFSQRPLPPGAHFLMVARPLREKGLREFFEASRLASQQIADATFSWLGPLSDANPSAIPESTIRSWLAESVVRHIVEQPDIRPYLAACSVLVLPSHREGTSKVVLEAMATGRAIVTTDAPGCRETVRNSENGMLVPVGDVQGLADAMVRLGRDQELRTSMGLQSRRIACERFDATRTDVLILDLLEGREGH